MKRMTLCCIRCGLRILISATGMKKTAALVVSLFAGLRFLLHRYAPAAQGQLPAEVEVRCRIPGLQSLAPPLAAVLLAFVLQRFLVALTVGNLMEAMICNETHQSARGWINGVAPIAAVVAVISGGCLTFKARRTRGMRCQGKW